VDQLVGGDGNDTLTGGATADHLTGGKGEDDFVYLSVADSAKQHDIITDFHHKQDHIDLTKLHPDTKSDKFVFIGAARRTTSRWSWVISTAAARRSCRYSLPA
jgi:Ca2+-binding RTX toxin-like protein